MKLYCRIKVNGKWTFRSLESAGCIICVEHRYIDQMGSTPCPECEDE